MTCTYHATPLPVELITSQIRYQRRDYMFGNPNVSVARGTQYDKNAIRFVTPPINESALDLQKAEDTLIKAQSQYYRTKHTNLNPAGVTIKDMVFNVPPLPKPSYQVRPQSKLN